MSPVPNTKLVFNEIPQGEPTLETLKVVSSEQIDPEADLKDDEILLKLVCVSLDPYMRGRLRPESVKSYVPAFPLKST
jgi:NADPH-dependent curcumin reductase CurA